MGSNLPASCSAQVAEPKTRDNERIIHAFQMAKNGNAATLCKLWLSQEDLDQVWYGKTFATVASKNGRNDVPQYLHERGVDLPANRPSREGMIRTPLFEAVCNNRLDTIRLLLKIGADPRKAEGGLVLESPLQEAVRMGSLPILLSMSEHSPDYIQAKMASGLLAVAESINFDDEKNRFDFNVRVVDFLLERLFPPELNILDIRDGAAIHYAARTGLQPLVQKLIRAGASPRLRDGRGRTAFELAYSNQHKDLAMYLAPERMSTAELEALWWLKHELATSLHKELRTIFVGSTRYYLTNVFGDRAQRDMANFYEEVLEPAAICLVAKHTSLDDLRLIVQQFLGKSLFTAVLETTRLISEAIQAISFTQHVDRLFNTLPRDVTFADDQQEYRLEEDVIAPIEHILSVASFPLTQLCEYEVKQKLSTMGAARLRLVSQFYKSHLGLRWHKIYVAVFADIGRLTLHELAFRMA